MAFLIDQLNNSGLFAQSAYSACIATKDSDGNDITATYLTGVDLTPYQTKAEMVDYQTTADMVNYQTTAGMTGYATTGDVANKLDTTAFSDVSGTFLTAHQSLADYATTAWVDSQGYLTAHQPISADEWNNVYDTVNVYSGSWTGSESSPTASIDSNGSIDIVSSNNTVYFDVNGTWFNDAVNSALPTSAVQWNSNYDTVNTNSGVWGGSALNISAGEGVKVTLVNNNLVFSTDETVLFKSQNGTSAVTLSEPFTNFETIKINHGFESNEWLNIGVGSELRFWHIYGNNNQATFKCGMIQASAVDSTHITVMNTKTLGYEFTSTSAQANAVTNNDTYAKNIITRVIGINRKNNA